MKMSEYEFAFEQEIAAMTVAEFIHWNPRFTEAEARDRIDAAKAKVDRLMARSGKRLQTKLDEGNGSLLS